MIVRHEEEESYIIFLSLFHLEAAKGESGKKATHCFSVRGESDDDAGGKLGPELLLWAQCYKTFYVRNLRIFFKKLECFVTVRYLQPSLMFLGQSRSLPK